MIARKLSGLALSLVLLGACSGSASDKVDSVWRDYANAVENGRGGDAVKLASADTIRHFDMLGDLALHGGKGMHNLTLYDEVSVYYLRYEYEEDALNRFSGHDIMKILVNKGLVGIPDMNGFSLEDVRIDDDEAWGELFTNEPNTSYRIAFELEGGKWKVDNETLGKSRDNVLIRRMMTYSGSRDEILDELLKSVGVRNGLTSDLLEPVAR